MKPNKPSLSGTDWPRVVLPLFGAVIGFFGGLVIGGLAATCIVALVLFAAGHPYPMTTLDAAFASRPIGWPALVIVATYIATAILGALLLYLGVRRFVLRLRLFPARDDGAQRAAEMAARWSWRGISRGKKAVLIMLAIATFAVTGRHFFVYQQAIAEASHVPTTERPVSINDHGHELYVTSAEKRVMRGWSIAAFVFTLSTIGYAFHVHRFFEFVVTEFRRRQGNARNG